MTQIERRFRKIITWFGALPGIFVPILVIGILHYIIPISSSEITAISTVSVLINSIMIMTIVGIWIGLSYTIWLFIKYYYYKPRPIPSNTGTTWQKISASSFPSIHSCNSVIIASFAIYSLSHIIITPVGLILTILFRFTLYLSIALSRIALQKHFPIDVLGWSILGLVISLVVISYNWQIISRIYYLLP